MVGGVGPVMRVRLRTRRTAMRARRRTERVSALQRRTMPLVPKEKMIPLSSVAVCVVGWLGG